MKKMMFALLFTCIATVWQTAYAGVCEFDDGSKKCDLTESQCISYGGNYHAEDKCKTSSTPLPIYQQFDINRDGVVSYEDVNFLRRTRFGLCTTLDVSLNKCLMLPIQPGQAGDVLVADGMLTAYEMYFEISGVCNVAKDAAACTEVTTLFRYINNCANGDVTACNSLKGI